MTNRPHRGLTPAQPSRRDFLHHSAVGLGGIALTSLLTQDAARAGTLSPKPQHHAAKAKSCIFLLMEGGPSHIDTFDPKPMLERLHMTGFAKERTKFAANMNTGDRYYVRSPFTFRRAGKMGIAKSTHSSRTSPASLMTSVSTAACKPKASITRPRSITSTPAISSAVTPPSAPG